MVSNILSSIFANPAAAAAVVAALIALIGGIAGPLVQLQIGKRQAAAAQLAANASMLAANASMLAAQSSGVREIGRMRLQWMEKLRDTLSEFHSILMCTQGEKWDGVQQDLSRLGTQLDLLLNQDDKLQKALWDITDAIYKCHELEKREAMDDDLVRA